eukprot:scaffold289246_cov31-Tisochrysis_lutea.AAC.1
MTRYQGDNSKIRKINTQQNVCSTLGGGGTHDGLQKGLGTKHNLPRWVCTWCLRLRSPDGRRVVVSGTIAGSSWPHSRGCLEGAQWQQSAMGHAFVVEAHRESVRLRGTERLTLQDADQ